MPVELPALPAEPWGRLVTLASFKSYAGITLSTWDTQIGDILDGVSLATESFIGRSLGITYYDQVLDVDYAWEQIFLVKQWPLQSVIALTCDDTPVSSLDYHFWENGKIALKGAGKKYLRGVEAYTLEPGQYFTQGIATIEISYQAGYAVIPNDIQLVVKRETNRLLNEVDHEKFLSEKIGDYSYKQKDLGAGFMPDTISILKKYQRAII